MPVRALDDHFAKVDPYPNFDAPIFRYAGVPLYHVALDAGCTLNRIDDAASSAKKSSVKNPETLGFLWDSGLRRVVAIAGNLRLRA